MLTKISKRSLFLFVADALAIPASFLLAIFFRSGSVEYYSLIHPWLILSFLIYLLMLYIFDFYYPYKYFQPTQTAIETLYAIGGGSLFLFAVPYLDRTFLIQRTVLTLTVTFLLVFIFFIRMVYDALFRSRFLDKRAIIVGTGPFAAEVYRIIRETPHSGMHVVGFAAEGEVYKEQASPDMHVLGDNSRLLSLVSWHNIDLVILAMEIKQKGSEPDIINALLRQKIQIVSGIHLVEKLDEAIPYYVLDEHYLLNLMSELRTHNYLKLKRVVDVVFSLLLLSVFLPVCLVFAAILATGGIKNIFYVQTRIGKDQKEFKLIKLKSMIEGRDGKYRITELGKWMRKYRIDEAPQLINVLKGDMSLIGPRPEISYFVEKCRKNIPFYETVFTVRPGLTGWAQVKFAHVTDMRDYGRKFQYNLYYLKNLSLTLDLIILFKTIRIILLGKGK